MAPTPVLYRYQNGDNVTSNPYTNAFSDDEEAANGVISFIVIGAGLIGPRHAAHIKQRGDCSLFAIIDHSMKGPSVASDLDALLFKNLDEMFDYCDSMDVAYPHAAIIATPNHTHVTMGLKLASKGIHLLVEKPLAPSPAECQTLINYCKMKNVKLLVGHHRRFNPFIMATKDNLHKIGTPIAMQGTWTLKKPDDYFLEKPWRSSVEKGGGTLLINLVHDLDLLQYLLGPIEKVYAELLNKQRTGFGTDSANLVDEGAALTIRFANGCCGTFICSDNVTSPFSFEAGTGENPTIPYNNSVAGFYRIFGSDGTLSVPDLKLYHQFNLPPAKRSWLYPVAEDQIKMAHEEIEVKFKNDYNEDNMMLPTPPSSLDSHQETPIHQNFKEIDPVPKPFDLQLNHFVNLINETESVSKCTGEDALRALLCIDAVIKSIETGLPQLVEPIESIDIDYDLMSQFA